MSAQVCGTTTGLSSEQRILRLLQASPEQQAAIDRVLEGRLAPEPSAPAGPLLMKIKDAAALLGVHRGTIWRLVKARRLETVELLGALRIRRSDIDALACGQTFRSGRSVAGKGAK